MFKKWWIYVQERICVNLKICLRHRQMERVKERGKGWVFTMTSQARPLIPLLTCWNTEQTECQSIGLFPLHAYFLFLSSYITHHFPSLPWTGFRLQPSFSVVNIKCHMSYPLSGWPLVKQTTIRIFVSRRPKITIMLACKKGIKKRKLIMY